MEKTVKTKKVFLAERTVTLNILAFSQDEAAEIAATIDDGDWSGMGGGRVKIIEQVGDINGIVLDN